MRRIGNLGLLVVIAGLLAGMLVVPAAKAAPGLVTVRVTIDKVSAGDCFEGTLFGCLGDPDFYSIVSIDGFEFPATGAIDDENNADPNPDWVFERQVDLTRGPAPVSIEIRDEDGGLRGDDDHADIDPTNGGNTYNLDLLVRLSPACEVTGDATLSTQQCGTIVTSTGTASDNKARVFYKIEVIDPDSDGDWLPDSWENGGLDFDGNGTVDVDLPAMGANPQRKDLFLELDCLVAAGSHSHCPLQGAIQSVVQSFADAPVSNIDGTTGIQLHVDIGNLYGQALGTDTKILRALAPAASVTGSFGNYGGGGNQIAEAGNTIVDWDGATGSPATSFYSLKGAPGNNFNANRALAFRYGLFVHQVNARAASNDCTSGWAEGGVNSVGTNLPGNDLIISMGGTNAAGNACWGVDAGGNAVGTQNEQAGTLQHEFGHTLSLDHGGGDVLNNKPNYLSVMNYSFQACSVPVVPAILPGNCDYSRIALPTLDEVNPPGLDECLGLGGGLGLGAVNWNGVGGVTGATCAPPSSNVSANVNGDFNDTDGDGTQDAGETNVIGQLPGFEDWNSIRYDFRTQGTFADGGVPSFPNEANPEIIASARAFLSQLLRPTLSVDTTGPADAIPGDTLNYGINVSNAGRGPAFNTVLTDTKPDTTQLTFNLGMAVVGAAFDRSTSYAVPCSTSDGTVLTNTASAVAEDLLGKKVLGSDSVHTTVHAPVLKLGKTATSAVNAGEAITYRLTYENIGGGAAANVVVTDTVPAGVYYSTALDLGAGPKPSTVTPNANGTRTLVWNVGALAGNSGPKTIEFTARPTLLALGGTVYTNGSNLSFTNGNGCVYADLNASASTTLTAAPPSQNPLTLGYWRNHAAQWTAEIRARIQATDQRYDGRDGSTPDGALSPSEVQEMYLPAGNQPKVLEMQLLSVYFNLATRRINAGTGVNSKTTTALGLTNVRDAAIYAQGTLALPVNSSTRNRFDTINGILDDINNNKKVLVY